MSKAITLQVGILLLLLSSLSVVATAATDDVVEDAAASDSQPRIIEGDILVADGEASLASRQALWRAVTQASSHRLWPDGIVPYRLHAGLPAVSIRAIEEAVDHWNRVSGITLLPLQSWPADMPDPEDSVLFQPGESCASWVGRRGGVQEVWVALNCNTGSMMHEIGHLLGLEHEHTRPDRDQHIRIHWENIDPDKHHNFEAAPAGALTIGDYDYASIMHYGLMNFSANGRPTLSALVPTDITIGQRQAPSAGDLAAVARLYGTDLSIATQIHDGPAGSEIEVHVTNNGRQGAHEIAVTVDFGDSRLQGVIGEQWQCHETTGGRASCALGRLSGGSRQTFTLQLDSAVTAGDVSASVSAKTPDDTPYNNDDSAAAEPAQAAANALEDPVGTVSQTIASDTGLGAGSGIGLLLLAALLYRLTGLRIDRQTGHRVERIG